jgi:hypothetical protein
LVTLTDDVAHEPKTIEEYVFTALLKLVVDVLENAMFVGTESLDCQASS